MSTRSVDRRPLVLLDMDGVVNAWPEPVYEPGRARVSGSLITTTMAWDVLLLDVTVEALKRVFEVAEVRWCTSWRHLANELMPTFKDRGLVANDSDLGVVTDGFRSDWGTRWKLMAVKHDPEVLRANREGRRVYWIEDFGWTGPYAEMSRREVTELGITPIDTWEVGYLRPAHLEGHF